MIISPFLVNLRLRMLNVQKSLNIDPILSLSIIKSVYMEYYLFIQSVFIKSKIAYKVKLLKANSYPRKLFFAKILSILIFLR